MRNDNTMTGRDQGLTAEEYCCFRELIERQTGVLLMDDKRLTFHMKVSHRLALLGIGTYQEYYDAIMSDQEGRELGVLLSHLIARDSCFFSDRKQFNLFSSVLKQITAVRRDTQPQSIKVLSAATGTGEEAYSINAVIHGNGLPSAGWDVTVTGMDFDESAIERAAEGRYSRDSFRDMNDRESFIGAYFDTDGQTCTVKELLRKHVGFRVGRLVDIWSFAGLGTQDVIFCRNVLSHMSGDGIQRAIRNMYRVLSDTGCLIIGTSESLIRLTNFFVPEYIDNMVLYRKNPGIGLEHDALPDRDSLRGMAG